MRLRVIHLILGLLICAGVPVSQAADRPRLYLSVFVPIAGGSCVAGDRGLLAGSSLAVTVRNPADTIETEPGSGWPPCYELDAALDLGVGQSFIATPHLGAELSVVPYVSAENLAAEWARQNGDPHYKVIQLNSKHFILGIPRGLANHTLTFRASYHHGELKLVSQSVGPFQITAPCDSSDEACILACGVWEAWEQDDNSRVLTLADSLVAIGWSSATGFAFAMSSASRLDRYDKQLEYLDRLFQDYGVTRTLFGGHDLPLNRRGDRDPAEQQVYEFGRRVLLEAIARQDSQH
jgi:hypothetical protein